MLAHISFSRGSRIYSWAFSFTPNSSALDLLPYLIHCPWIDDSIGVVLISVSKCLGDMRFFIAVSFEIKYLV